MACSAVVIELPKGVFITMMPRLRGGGDVDIVDADAGAADHLELGRGFAISFSVTLVAERMARPSYWPMICGELLLVLAEVRIE
jgi:hypothetical protein